MGLNVQVLAVCCVLLAIICFTTMADKSTSRARKRTYNKISDTQRSKLQEYYDRDMKTCGSDNFDRIGMAAEETGLTIDQVKVRYLLVRLIHYHSLYVCGMPCHF